MYQAGRVSTPEGVTVTEIHDQLSLDCLPAWTSLTVSVNERPFAAFVWTGDSLVDPTTAAVVDLRFLVHQYGPLLVLP